MSKYKSLLIGVVGVMVFGGVTHVSAAESQRVIRLAGLAADPVPAPNLVSGEITWVDVKLGKLQLRDQSPRGNQSVTEYRMNQQTTNVTDPTDKKFLTLEDLRAGQRIAVEFEPSNVEGEWMARKITVEPPSTPEFQEAFGELEAIDVNAGTFVLEERPAARREGARGYLTYYSFQPSDIVVMRSPSREPVRLELQPGDPIKVEYVMKDGKRWARSITAYSAVPETIDRTTVTTTTTSTTTTR